jgi:hypothetical protein
MLAALLAQWRYGLYGLLVVALFAFGWQVNTWRNNSAKLADAQVALRAAIQQQIEADAARADAERRISLAQGKIVTQTKEIIRRVKVVVRDRTGCDLDGNAVRLLNDARSGVVPPASGDTTSPSTTTTPDP